jgi:hypothetical protein
MFIKCPNSDMAVVATFNSDVLPEPLFPISNT